MAIQKLNIPNKTDNASKKKMVQSNTIGANETLMANEVNALVAKTNELVDAYNFGAPITAFNFKTNVPTYADLPLVGNEVNDGYGVIADGLVYVWNGTAFPPEGDGMNLGLRPDGKVEEGDVMAVSGGEVYDKTLSDTITYKYKDDCVLGYYDLTGSQPSELLSSTTNICGIFDITEVDKVYLEYTRGGNISRTWAFVDENNNILTRAEASVIITEKTEIPIPQGAVRLYINSSFSTSIDYRDKFKLTAGSLVKLKFSDISQLTKENTEVLKSLTKEERNIDSFQRGYYNLTGSQPSELLSSAVTRSAIIDVTNVDTVDLIRIYGGTSSRAYAFVDVNNDIILVAESNARFGRRVLDKPDGAVKLYVNTSSSDPVNYPFSEVRVNLYYSSYPLIQEIENLKNKESKYVYLSAFLPKRTDGYNGVKNTFSLAGTDIALHGNKYYTKGYLFTEYPASNGKVYYANSINEEPQLICDFVGLTGLVSQYAISPKHRTVIRAIYDGLQFDFKIFENGTYSSTNFEKKPNGWLYNFGQYFGEDANGDEYFLCGEYSHSRTPSRRIFKATYPYSNPENWQVVHEFVSPEIHHIHQIIKDPYTDYIYCFTGDSPSESNIYYSSNNGDAWSLLARSQDIGSGTNAVLRATNVHFFEDKVLYASDDDYHVLVEIFKDVNGLLDISTLNIITHLKSGQMTNGSYYDYNSNRLYMMDRVRVATSTLEMYCYDFNEEKLIKIGEYKQTPTTSEALWGNRGRGYIVYPNNSDRIFGMGISERIHLNIDFPENDNNTYGGIYYRL